jgi:hypothetical protein
MRRRHEEMAIRDNPDWPMLKKNPAFRGWLCSPGRLTIHEVFAVTIADIASKDFGTGNPQYLLEE